MDRDRLLCQLKEDEGFQAKAKWDIKQFSYGYGCKAPSERAWFQIPEGVSPDLYFMRIILNNTVRWLEAKITPTTDIFAVLGDNFPPILAGATASFTGTVTGARAGDRVSVGVYTGDGLAGVAMLSGICTVNDSVTVYMTNVSGSTIDPSGNNYYVTVTK
jgi:hypothetical protein